MTINHLRRYRGALERAREQTMLVVAATSPINSRRSDRPGPSARDPEIEAIEAEIDALIADQENQTLSEIDAALYLLQVSPDAFGCCEVCGGEIARERLDATPWESRCDAHRDDPFRL